MTPSEFYECQVYLKMEFDRRKLVVKLQKDKDAKAKSIVKKTVSKSISKGKSKITLFTGIRDVN